LTWATYAFSATWAGGAATWCGGGGPARRLWRAGRTGEQVESEGRGWGVCKITFNLLGARFWKLLELYLFYVFQYILRMLKNLFLENNFLDTVGNDRDKLCTSGLLLLLYAWIHGE
jgi:hypothetical protein